VALCPGRRFNAKDLCAQQERPQKRASPELTDMNDKGSLAPRA